jgi:hypothetical protein
VVSLDINLINAQEVDKNKEVVDIVEVVTTIVREEDIKLVEATEEEEVGTEVVEVVIEVVEEAMDKEEVDMEVATAKGIDKEVAFNVFRYL